MILSPESTRLPAARRFGMELRRAIKARDSSVRALSLRMKIVGRGRIHNYLNGSSLPSLEVAEALADALMWPRLVDLARAGRERQCDECGRTFAVAHSSPQRYCSPECKRTRAKVREGSRDLSRAVLERRARRYEAAVEAMCRACEPGGYCRTADCPLQAAGVSPLTLSKEA